MASEWMDEQKLLSLIGDADRHISEIVVSGMGAIGGSTICSIIAGAVACPFGPPGFFLGVVPGAIVGGIMGGAIGNTVGKEFDDLRREGPKTLKL